MNVPGLIELMVTGPDLPVRGEIRSTGSRHVAYGWYGAPPIHAGHAPGGNPGRTLSVLRHGALLRLTDAEGRPTVVVGTDLAWDFTGTPSRPRATDSANVRWHGNGTEVVRRRTYPDLIGTRVPTGPVGGTTFLDRAAYTVQLGPLQLVVDAETGLVLQERNDAAGTVDEWVVFEVVDAPDPALFSWDGPVRDDAEVEAERDAESRAEVAERLAWFRDNVTAHPLTTEVQVPVSVHTRGADGSFEASLTDPHGSLARRATSDEPWTLAWSGGVAHRWTTPRWDWALMLHGDTVLTAAGLAALQRQLG